MYSAFYYGDPLGEMRLVSRVFEMYIRLCIRIEQQSQEMEEKMRLAEQIQRQEEEQTEKNRKPRTESR